MTDEAVIKEFRKVVNMSPAKLERHLETEESREVGSKPARGGESVGHRSGRKNVSLLTKHKEELTEADIAHMRKVVGYVHRHLAQRPEGDVTDTNWRTSLMNWGHDPLER